MLQLPDGSVAESGVRVVLVIEGYHAEEYTNSNGIADFRNVPGVYFRKERKLLIQSEGLVVLSEDKHPPAQESTVVKVARKLKGGSQGVSGLGPSIGMNSNPGPNPNSRPNPPQSIRELAVLPSINYGAFEVTDIETMVDMREWVPFDSGAAKSRVSPVKTTRRISAVKNQAVDFFRLYSATEGLGIDIECLSGQPYYIEYAETTGKPRTNLMKEYHLVADISSVPVGSTFQVEARMTMWNGMQEKDPWFDLVSFTNTPLLRGLFLFPQDRPYKSRKFVKYVGDSGDEVGIEGVNRQLESPDHRKLYWEIKEAKKGTSYELQWSW